MAAIWAMAIKDVRLLLRDRGATFFTFAFPLMVALFFGYIFAPRSSGDEVNKLNIVAVNEDGGPASIEFLKDLRNSDSLAVEDVPDRKEAESRVRKGKGGVLAAVIIPSGFQKAADNMFSGEAMQIIGLVDPSRGAEAGLLTGKLNEIGFRQMGKTFNDPKRMSGMLDSAKKSLSESKNVDPVTKTLFTTMFGAMDNLSQKQWGRAGEKTDGSSGESSSGFTWQPVKVTVENVKPEGSEKTYDSFAVSFPQGIIWGLMGCVAAFSAGIAAERTGGTLMRLTTAPIDRSTILLGKALACFISCLLVQVFIILVGVAMGKLSLHRPHMLLMAILLSSFGFVGVMMLLVGLCRTEAAANGLGRASILVLAMIGGGSIPLMFMPPIMKTVSNISPFKWANEVVGGALWRDFNFVDMLLPGGVLLAMGAVGFVVGTSLFTWSDGNK